LERGGRSVVGRGRAGQPATCGNESMNVVINMVNFWKFGFVVWNILQSVGIVIY
jgi:hypothetical protein